MQFDEPFVMSVAEVNTDTQRYHPPADKRRRRHFEARAARAAKVAKLPRATLKVMRTAKLSHLPAN
jgi:hypothetical protein